jgi:hypothetical protein
VPFRDIRLTTSTIPKAKLIGGACADITVKFCLQPHSNHVDTECPSDNSMTYFMNSRAAASMNIRLGVIHDSGPHNASIASIGDLDPSKSNHPANAHKHH